MRARVASSVQGLSQGREGIVAASPCEPVQVLLPGSGQELLVEMRRTRGDPVLFVKPADAGFQAGALPAYQDFDQFAVRYFALGIKLSSVQSAHCVLARVVHPQHIALSSVGAVDSASC